MKEANLGQVNDEPAPLPAKTWLEVCGPILWGLGFAAEAGGGLLSDRLVAGLALGFVTLVWWFWLLWLVWSPKAGLPGAPLYILFRLGLALPYHYLLSTHVWGPPMLGVLFAGYFWAEARSSGRPPLVPVVNCALIGLLTICFPLSNLQRCRIAFLSIGIAVALSGAVNAIRQAWGRSHPPDLSRP